jgi:acyl carrier protein
MTPTQFFESVKLYLTGKQPRLDHSLLTPEANLWELGYIDSLNTVELILFVEDIIERRITIESSDVRSFGSIQSIYQNYVQ